MIYPQFIKSCYSGQEPFRLYFAGGGVSNYLQHWFDANNVLKLFTQVTDRKAISNWLSSRRRDNIFLDSGAWVAHSRGVEIDVKRMVESKSLKLYLFSFRNHGDFHEDCTNIIMKDLIKLMDSKYIEVKGNFLPRGGISILPFANYAKPGSGYECMVTKRQFDQLSLERTK